jgi:hypothetical protein
MNELPPHPEMTQKIQEIRCQMMFLIISIYTILYPLLLVSSRKEKEKQVVN